MTRGLKYSVITASVGNLGDRFCGSYKSRIDLHGKLEKLDGVEGLSGLELVYDDEGDESDPVAVKEVLSEHGMVASAVNAPLSSNPRWQLGTFTANDASTRAEAVAITKRSIDFAKAVRAEQVNLWLGQDGFDYCFQVDYRAIWERLLESLRECADYASDISLCLEFKPREPRNRSLLNSAATTLLVIQEIDRENVGMTVDVGHVLQNRENMAQVVDMVHRYGKLYNLHLNDNYAAWDDDMIVGSVHLLEFLELFYELRKIGYDRWCAVDIFPFREDQFAATRESIAFMRACEAWVERIGLETVSQMVQTGEVPDNLRRIRESILK